MFRGVHYISLDGKGRLAVPARQRDPMRAAGGGRLVVTIDIGSPCLLIYPLPEWERIERDVQALPTMKPAIKRFQRLFLGHATDLELDGSGRILLPQALRDYAQLDAGDRKLVLMGLSNKLELWSEALWAGEREQALQEAAANTEVPEELLQLNL